MFDKYKRRKQAKQQLANEEVERRDQFIHAHLTEDELETLFKKGLNEKEIEDLLKKGFDKEELGDVADYNKR